MADSSFAKEMLSQYESESGQQIANTPANLTQDFLGRAAPEVMRGGEAALGEAAGLNTTTTTTPGFWQTFMQGLQATSQGAGEAIGAAAA